MDDSAPLYDNLPSTRFSPLPAVVPPGRRVPLLCLVMAVAAVVVFWGLGFLPWLLNDNGGLEYVWLPVPLLAGQLPALIASTTIGTLAATTLPLLFPDVPRALGVVVVSLSVAVTAVAVVSVARLQLADQSEDSFAGDPRVLDGLVAGVIALVVGLVVLGALAAFRIGLLPVVVAVAATQLSSWLAGLELPDPARVAELLTVVLLAGAFVLSVQRSVVWIVTWPVALAVVWLGPPSSAATLSVATRLRPGQNLDSSLRDVYASGWDVFRAALVDAPRTWWPSLVAAGIGVSWWVVQAWRSRAAE